MKPPVLAPVPVPTLRVHRVLRERVHHFDRVTDDRLVGTGGLFEVQWRSPGRFRVPVGRLGSVLIDRASCGDCFDVIATRRRWTRLVVVVIARGWCIATILRRAPSRVFWSTCSRHPAWCSGCQRYPYGLRSLWFEPQA